MEERNIFNDKYIHFKWEDYLEGKKGFFSDSACNFKDYICNPTTKENFYAEEIITRSLDNEEYPFEDPDGGQWKFVYYDPNYEAKIAWKNGNEIQYKDNDGIWYDLLSSKPLWGAIEYRIKPDRDTKQKQYRPFKDINELRLYWRNTHSLIADQFFVDCEPLIWVKFKNLNYKVMINGFYEESNKIILSSSHAPYTLQELYNEFTFIDGKPFGIEVDE